MAKTKLSDIIYPSVFQDSVLEMTATVSRLVQSGIVEITPEFNELASGKAKTVNMPFWQDLSGNSEELSDSGSLDVNAITQAQDIAVKHFRGKAWSANDLVKYIVGDDPMMRVVERVAAWWDRDMQTKIVVPSLTGIFATALASTHVHDIAAADAANATDANLIGSDAVIDAAGKLGDNWDKITGMVMHSVPFRRLQKLNLIETEKLQDQDIVINRFLGREVIVDDGCRTVAISNGYDYHTYLFGRGALAMGNSTTLAADEAVETDRDILAGDDILVNRRHFLLHPRGVAFTGSPAGTSPTSTELQTGSNWTKKWETKNIRVIDLVTNG